MKEFIEAGQVRRPLDGARRSSASPTRSCPRPNRRSRRSTATTTCTRCRPSSTSRASGTTRQILADNGIEAPTTWDDLVAAAATLQGRRRAALLRGRQGRLAASPASSATTSSATSARTPCRRSPTATPSSPTPSTSQAADAVAELGEAGYFGDARRLDRLQHRDEPVPHRQGRLLLHGQLGARRTSTTRSRTTIGADNIGFVPFPAVEGGAGSIDQVPANVGVPGRCSPEGLRRRDQAAWLKCIAENYGDTVARTSSGVITGFAVDERPPTCPQLTTDRAGHDRRTRRRACCGSRRCSPRRARPSSQTNGGGLVSGQHHRRGLHEARPGRPTTRADQLLARAGGHAASRSPRDRSTADRRRSTMHNSPRRQARDPGPARPGPARLHARHARARSSGRSATPCSTATRSPASRSSASTTSPSSSRTRRPATRSRSPSSTRVVLTVVQVGVGLPAWRCCTSSGCAEASALIRTLVFFPVVLPTVAVALLFQKLFEVGAARPARSTRSSRLLGVEPVDWFGSAGGVVLGHHRSWTSGGRWASTPCCSTPASSTSPTTSSSRPASTAPAAGR